MLGCIFILFVALYISPCQGNNHHLHLVINEANPADKSRYHFINRLTFRIASMSSYFSPQTNEYIELYAAGGGGAQPLDGYHLVLIRGTQYKPTSGPTIEVR